MNFWSTVAVLFAGSYVQSCFGQLNSSYPVFRKIHSNCSSFPETVDGQFLFLDGAGSAYYRVTSSWLYFEYWAPTSSWVGIGSADQTISGIDGQCLSCFLAESQTELDCVDVCINNNTFVISGVGEPDPQNSWKTIESKIENLRLPLMLSSPNFRNASVQFDELCFDGSCDDYVHVSWFRTNINSERNTWIVSPGSESLCWSWIASNKGEPFVSEAVHGVTVNQNGVVCSTVNAVCSTARTPVSTKRVSTKPVSPKPVSTKPVSIPPTYAPVADIDVPLPQNGCDAQNLGIVFLLDASQSVSNANYDLAKDWITNLLRYSSNIVEEKNAADASSVCLRTSLVTFSYQVDIVWNLDSFGDCYQQSEASPLLIDLGRPHNSRSRLRGTHTKDAFETVANQVLPLRRDDESLLVILLTDGLPLSVNANQSQSPCDETPSTIQEFLVNNDARFGLVGVELNSDEIQDFSCLFDPYSDSDSFASVNNYRSLNYASAFIKNMIVERFCGDN